jgi:2-dehydro-3-deoxyphosphogluconate aldolase/(4S)-4-hydroxy-2-oxoglutarate aldolase
LWFDYAVIPTGGVNLNNVASFVKAGVAAVGIGGHLVDHQAIETSDYDRITQTARQYVSAIEEARQY